MKITGFHIAQSIRLIDTDQSPPDIFYRECHPEQDAETLEGLSDYWDQDLLLAFDFQKALIYREAWLEERPELAAWVEGASISADSASLLHEVRTTQDDGCEQTLAEGDCLESIQEIRDALQWTLDHARRLDAALGCLLETSRQGHAADCAGDCQLCRDQLSAKALLDQLPEAGPCTPNA